MRDLAALRLLLYAFLALGAAVAPLFALGRVEEPVINLCTCFAVLGLLVVGIALYVVVKCRWYG